MNDFGSNVFAPFVSAPLLARTDHGAPSVFRVENMLREARRQKELASDSVPEICVFSDFLLVGGSPLAHELTALLGVFVRH